MFHRVPADVIRHSILPHLLRADLLALRNTSKQLHEIIRNSDTEKDSTLILCKDASVRQLDWMSHKLNFPQALVIGAALLWDRPEIFAWKYAPSPHTRVIAAGLDYMTAMHGSVRVAAWLADMHYPICLELCLETLKRAGAFNDNTVAVNLARKRVMVTDQDLLDDSRNAARASSATAVEQKKSRRRDWDVLIGSIKRVRFM